MRRAPIEFIEKLQRMDAQLDVEWVPANKRGMVRTERWRIVRKHPDGRLRHIFFVEDPDGSYRHLDDRVLERLHRIDAHRFYNSAEMLEWFKENTDEDSKKRMEATDFLDARYHDSIEQLADEMERVARDDPHTTQEQGQRAMDALHRRTEAGLAVEQIQNEQRGRVVMGPEGYAVPG